MWSITLCASNHFIKAEPNFTLHFGSLENKVMVSEWQVMPQLVGETFDKLGGASWECCDLKGII